ncbi:MAG: hydantoinase/oxoprolinase family protein [Pseudomonadota bacterium]
MAVQHIRLSADIGGTFTDVVLQKGDHWYTTKSLTTYTAPEEAILTGLRQVCSEAQVDPADIAQVIHGTTLATNTLIERSGARTALITTAGFRDVIEMRTESRFEQYDLNLKLPAPLLARQHRYTVSERMNAHGRVLRSLDEAALQQLIDRLAAAGYESIAVGFLHAYANPQHEQRVRDLFATMLPDVPVSLSSEVSPQMREYERFNTVVANAYIKPLMQSYLQRLSGRLAETGCQCPVFLMHSGGGIISLADAAEFPVRLVESGPAGGAVFASRLAQRHAIQRALSFDMGGTTAKVCLVRDGRANTSRSFEVARSYRFKKGSGMPISIPVVDMVEIGAGGGSLATVDAMQQIRVGPRSAGSEPGPACYQRGGSGAAVTDADLVLGKLAPDQFAGGAIQLSTQAAQAALMTHVGDSLSLAPEAAAFGVCEVVDENMANAARVHAVENGEDVATLTLVAFGGAAPLHAGRLCEKLGIERWLVPARAGVGSAVGFLMAPFSFEASRGDFSPLSALVPSQLRSLLSTLKTDAEAFVRSCGATTTRLSFTVSAYMRYQGQGWEVAVLLDEAFIAKADLAQLQSEFEASYQRRFGRLVEAQPIEITGWSVTAETPVPPPALVAPAASTSRLQAEHHQPLFDARKKTKQDAGHFWWQDLSAGDVVDGPAVILDRETTIVVPDGHRAVQQTDGALSVHRVSVTK